MNDIDRIAVSKRCGRQPGNNQRAHNRHLPAPVALSETVMLRPLKTSAGAPLPLERFGTAIPPFIVPAPAFNGDGVEPLESIGSWATRAAVLTLVITVCPFRWDWATMACSPRRRLTILRLSRLWRRAVVSKDRIAA